MTLSRRRFLSSSSAALAALGAPAVAWPSLSRRSPNEELRVAVVGVRGRGMAHVNGFGRLANVRVVALVDVDSEVLGRRKKELGERGVEVTTHADLREVLERDDIDIVSIASPNHWHALQAIWSCQAGKDVYVEKPISHDPWEGARLVEAARKYGRIVQTGTQCRSSRGLQEAIRWVQEGNLGKIKHVRGLCYKPRRSIGKVQGPQEPPASVDYDLWTGPAPLVPLHRRQLHYDWHWDHATGNGDLGNQGVHQMDIARWIAGHDGLPDLSVSVGGRLGYDDDGNTPNTQVVMHHYEGGPDLIFEVRGLPRDKAAQAEDWGGRMDSAFGVRIGVLVNCEGGALRIPSYESATAFDRESVEVKSWREGGDHFANFVDAVRSRERGDLTADIHEGDLSSTLCHLGNLSLRVGRPATMEDIQDAMTKVPLAAESCLRMVAHLEANGVDLEKTPLTRGAALRVDGKSGEIVGNEVAARLAHPEYRAPFVVPSEV